MRMFCTMLAVLALAGCNKERLDEGAEKERAIRKDGKINVDGKLVDAPPAGIGETLVLVEGRWMRAKDEGVTWHVSCGENGCKPKLGPAPKKKD